MITTGRNCGSAEWININIIIKELISFFRIDYCDRVKILLYFEIAFICVFNTLDIHWCVVVISYVKLLGDREMDGKHVIQVAPMYNDGYQASRSWPYERDRHYDNEAVYNVP